MEDKLEAKVTFVVFEDEVMAFFRAFRNKGDRNWTKVAPRAKYTGSVKPTLYMAQEGYVHCGQHGEFDVEILQHSRKASPDEYKDLMNELNRIGYKVTPHQMGRLTLRG